MGLGNQLIKNLTIVLVGNFNPAIVSPHWLVHKKAIRISDAESADLKITHPEISDFSLSFVDIRVEKDKFILSCENEADFDLVKDLAISIFSALSETPIQGIGLNHIYHFNFEKEKQFIEFGNWLAPHKHWKDEMTQPKLLELKMTEPFMEGSSVKSLISIASNDKLGPFGVKFLVNYHIEMEREVEKLPSKIIPKYWDESKDKTQRIFNSLNKNFNG